MKSRSSIFDLFRLENKTIILSGAGGLLGTQYANALSAVGANVVLVDINKDIIEKLENSLRKKFGTNPLAIEINISKKDEVVNLTKTVLKKYKHIDVLINNAAYTKLHPFESAPFEEYPLDLWNEMLNVNLTGVFLCSQVIGKEMAKRRNGVIINISSIYGMVGADQRIYANSNLNSSVAYAATKSAILNLTRYLASYWHGKNVRVNSLSLGGVFNNQKKEFVKNYNSKTILGRMAKKDEYNSAIIFLSSDASSYMTGSNVVIDGGWTAW